MTDEGSTLRGVAREKLCLRWQPGASPAAPAAAASQGGETPDHDDGGGQALSAGGGEVGWQGHVPSVEEVMKLAAAAETGDSNTALMFRRSPEGAVCRQRAVTGTLTEGDKRELPKCFHKLLDHLESPTTELTGTKVKPADYANMLNERGETREIDLVILRRKLGGIAKGKAPGYSGNGPDLYASLPGSWAVWAVFELLSRNRLLSRSTTMMRSSDTLVTVRR